MCVSKSASRSATDNPRAARPWRNSDSVEAGPGSTSARCPPDSRSAAAIERGRPTQFVSNTVTLLMATVQYIYLSWEERCPAEVNEGKISETHHVPGSLSRSA